MNPSARGGTFFRTMVLMGSSVAVGCGGTAELVPGRRGGVGVREALQTAEGPAEVGRRPVEPGPEERRLAAQEGLRSTRAAGGSSGGQQGFGGRVPHGLPDDSAQLPDAKFFYLFDLRLRLSGAARQLRVR